MIVTVRGCHGSGKSTVVREVMEHLGHRISVTEPERSRPLFYLCANSVVALGSYENECGGCDTIPEVTRVYELADHHAFLGRHVLFEGILAQHSSSRLLELARRHPVTVIALTTSFADCVASVRERRLRRGDTRPMNMANLEKEFRGNLSSLRRIRNSGIPVQDSTREGAAAKIIEMIK